MKSRKKVDSLKTSQSLVNRFSKFKARKKKFMAKIFELSSGKTFI